MILDEAQDTDPAQFDVLLELARPPAESVAPPRAGHFCMVGDFQQSIYGRRADLPHYRRIHETLVASGAGEALEFSVTFRLGARTINFVNAVFPAVLNGRSEQVDFVRLNARPGVLPGQVVRFDVGPPLDPEWKEPRRVRHEAQQLARWLREQGLERLRATSWDQVAVLCPRRRWFAPLCAALRVEGFTAQIQSERDLCGDNPVCAWFTALVVILAEPRHSYEIVGVLREVFGLSDHDLALFSGGNGARFQIAEPSAGTSAVAETLTLLADARARLVTLPLFSALEEMVRATQLRERLLSLPADDFENRDAELDELLTLGANAEVASATLPEFAEDLRRRFATVREPRTAEPGAIQLITGHKAKGSEWQAVIVPFFARGVKTRSDAYPKLIREPETRTWLAALDGEDLDGDLADTLKLQAQHEAGRLLYVALTRTRHTLVLVDDRALFAGKEGLPTTSQAALLHCGNHNVNAANFHALPATLLPCHATAAAEREVRRGDENAPPLAPLSQGSVAVARARATHFLKRNPSAIAETELPLEPPHRVAAGLNAGQRYGTWWHSFVERLDWQAPPSSWDAIFEKALDHSPNTEISRHEWGQLRSQLATGSDFARGLTVAGAVAHAEMPLLWSMNAGECLEGVLDLAVFDPVRGAWLIVDWKTNRVRTDELPALRKHYLPQLSAYWKAVTSMLAATATAGLYSTATGAWLPYETSELSAGWDALESSSAALAAALCEP